MPTVPTSSPTEGRPPDELRGLADAFERAFLTEMLRHSGLADMPDSFNGGVGEDAFSSMLIGEYAGAISEQSSIGLSDQIYAILQRGGGKVA